MITPDEIKATKEQERLLRFAFVVAETSFVTPSSLFDNCNIVK